MAQNSYTTQSLKSIYFPDSDNKQTIKLYIKHKWVQDASYNKVTLQAYVETSSSAWHIGKWSDYGSYLKVGDTQTDYTQDIPANTSGAYKIKELTFNLSNTTTSATVGWKFGYNPSAWLGDTTWNRPSGTFTISMKSAHFVTYDANGGSGAPSKQTKIYGTNLTLSSTKPSKSGHTFTGWNTKSDGSGTAYASGATYSTESDLKLYAQYRANYTSCGTPTNLTVTGNSNNTVTLSCKSGASGTSNTVNSVELFVTYNGTTPTTSNYNEKFTISTSASTTVSKIISFANLPQSTISSYFGTDYSGSVKFTARTLGSAGSSYYSSTVTAASGTFTWHSNTTPPLITTPRVSGDTTGLLSSYRVSWNAGGAGINNAVYQYKLKVYNVGTGTVVNTYTTTNTYYDVPKSNFYAPELYRFYISTIGTTSGFDSPEVSSGTLSVMNISKISTPNVSYSDGNTVASTALVHESLSDYADRTFINIGSGEVVKLSWPSPSGTNNVIDSYTLSLYKYDLQHGLTYTIKAPFNIGNVNEYYITADDLATVTDDRYILVVQLYANSKYGSNYNGYTALRNIPIEKGCGIYVKCKDVFGKPYMKRAIAFARVKDGVSSTSGNWKIMKEAYASEYNCWKRSDIRYEALLTTNGELVADSNGEIIYTL